MNENLNLVEILKDCPKRTELYSTICGIVEFRGIDAKSGDYPIDVYCKQTKDYYSFTADGRIYCEANFGECLLFPSKDQRDWSKWHRPFVDGDIVTVNGLDVGIYAHENTYYCMLCDNILYKQTIHHYHDIRLATEEEKEKLFKAIKDNGYQWNAEEKKLEKLITPKFKVGDNIKSKDDSIAPVTITDISDRWYHCKNACASFGLPIDKQDDYEFVVSGKFDPKTLQPFDKVLVRDECRRAWTCDFFSFLYDKFVRCVGACYVYCIPYNDDTKHLVDKKSEAPEYYRYWENNTSETKDNTNGHEYVDLGLPSGLKWATCSVGASKPEDYGNYYAWGETETKDTYDYDNSLTYGLSISELESQGYIDGKGNLTPAHDAVTANWGGAWRMPTKAEFEELKNNCSWKWTTQNGVNGYKVTGTNGNSIFLPAAGFRFGSSLYRAGSSGYYWSSTPGESYSYSAWNLYFNSSEYDMYDNSRYYGRSVRPVIE